MKEIPLRELMSMADSEAHEGIGELWNQKSIHYLVVFTSADADFEIIGAGPTLPYATLEAAGEHVIPGKKAEFYVKCPGAIAGRMQPKFAPNLTRPATRSPVPVAAPAVAAAPVAEAVVAPAPVEASPSLKGKTSAPFMRPMIKLGPRVAPASGEQGVGSKEQGAGSGERESPKVAAAGNPTPSAKPEAKPESSDLVAREAAIAVRERELAALFEALKIREASLRERETAIAAVEERLLNPARKRD
jgi:hypothetical protein